MREQDQAVLGGVNVLLAVGLSVSSLLEENEPRLHNVDRAVMISAKLWRA